VVDNNDLTAHLRSGPCGTSEGRPDDERGRFVFVRATSSDGDYRGGRWGQQRRGQSEHRPMIIWQKKSRVRDWVAGDW
jgi:hypothetical protein